MYSYLLPLSDVINILNFITFNLYRRNGVDSSFIFLLIFTTVQCEFTSLKIINRLDSF